MKMKVVLDPGAYMPTLAHADDGGYDLRSPLNFTIPPRGHSIIVTGVHIALPRSCVGRIENKSSVFTRLHCVTSGLIDPGYTGSICVTLYNLGDSPVRIEKGQKIAQLVITPVKRPRLKLVARLKDTERGSGGVGSTGTF